MVKGMMRKSFYMFTAPVASVAGCYIAVMKGALHPSLLVWALATVALCWSPLPVSLAAVLMDQERVGTLSHERGVKRAFRLIPEMLKGEHREVTVYHLVGFAVCLVALLQAVILSR